MIFLSEEEEKTFKVTLKEKSWEINSENGEQALDSVLFHIRREGITKEDLEVEKLDE